MMKYLMIVLRLIPVLIVTPLFLLVLIMQGMGPIGNEPGGNANRTQELAVGEIFIAIWMWAFSGKYERDTTMSDYQRNK